MAEHLGAMTDVRTAHLLGYASVSAASGFRASVAPVICCVSLGIVGLAVFAVWLLLRGHVGLHWALVELVPPFVAPVGALFGGLALAHQRGRTRAPRPRARPFSSG